MTNSLNAEFLEEQQNYLPAISVDVVIFGFHQNELKTLLLQLKDKETWALPGGFVFREEHLETAAKRVLQQRTGLTDIFLEQFHIFGDPERTRLNNRAAQLDKQLENDEQLTPLKEWVLQRFVSVGYYALVEYTQVNPQPDLRSVECNWYDVHSLPSLMADHREIIERALKTLRQHLNSHPVGMNLLPREFTMPELQRLYETILGTSLDRRNFQRRILSYKILQRLPQKRTGGAYKAPYLYRFDHDTYQQALQNGLKDLW